MATRFLLCFLLQTISLFLFTSSSRPNLTIELIHRDSPRSPLYNSLDTISDRLKAAFRRSVSRSRHFKNPKAPFSSKTDLKSGLLAEGGEYFMSISLGTPPLKVLAIADTGSDLTWVQCRPCQQCYRQTGKIFDKTKSSTYKNEPCGSHVCHALDITERGCDISGNVCKYRYSYGDQSFTRGDIATETIAVASSSSPVSFPGIVFGCGYSNGGTFDETGSGIIGLGGGPLSLVSQLGSTIGKKFSYCLSHTSSTANGTSVINLGTNSVTLNSDNDPPVVATPLIDKAPNTYYYLTLEAITVGKTRIPYTGASYNLNGDDEISQAGNIIIDSGTTLTLLDSGFYDKFGSVVEDSVTGAKPVSDPEGLLTHCFRSGEAEIGLPEIIVHFTGADVRLSPMNAFVRVRDDLVCLSMIPTTDVAIFGNLAQMDFLVGYDLEARTVSFQPMDCSRSV
ncbi:PREDICTED: probable aspartic protease At2g35615 [Tarenaya hassleriana]|uniref:probable aspartic protease At2g35615 n=1 Tax=Tarenaya hassleriana TaxID=28532 RepID=UPI00053C8C2F|nr:PREDICTED: probable aspartic protease At2g35615 [Tarenaya hassleriana]